MALIDGQELYCKFDSDIVDATGNYTPINNGSTDTSSGKINNGRDFNGSSNSINSGVPSNALSGDFSISCWVHADDTASQGMLWGDLRAGSVSMFLRINANNIEFRVGSGGTVFSPFIQVPFTDTTSYNHIVATHKVSTKTIGLWVNGSKQDTEVYVGTRTNSSYNYFISAFSDGTVAFFDGRIDEIGVWSSLLSDSEITELWNSGAGLQYPYSTEEANSSKRLLLGDNF